MRPLPRPGRVRRVAALAAVAVSLVVVGCGSDDNDSQSFCAALRSAPSLEEVVAGHRSG